MKAKSEALSKAGANKAKAAKALPAKRARGADAGVKTDAIDASPKKGSRKPTARLPAAERRAQIMAKGYEFFSEYGLTAQTRALAEACGVSQRLLYSIFPSKAELLKAVYDAEIAGRFKAIWFAKLQDRSSSVEERLTSFYHEYLDEILTRRWLRLFLYASLAEEKMAPNYIDAIVRNLLDVMVSEAAHEAGLVPPANAAERLEIGWILHGGISHLAIRRHIYNQVNPVDPHRVIELQVRSFLAGLPGLLSRA